MIQTSTYYATIKNQCVVWYPLSEVKWTKYVIFKLSATRLSAQNARIDEAQGTNMVSSSTVDLSTVVGNYITITGTTTITAFGTVQAGAERTLEFSGILTLTHNATSLILPGAANITTAAGDTTIFRSEGSGNWRCISYNLANGNPVTGAGF